MSASAAAIVPEPMAKPRKIFNQTGDSGRLASATADPAPMMIVVPIT
jgi:hypothetical protein